VNNLPPKIYQPIDWIAASKTFSIELAFLSSIAAAVLLHLPAAELQFCESVAISTGVTLGVLRITDVISNAATIRSYLANPSTTGLGGMAPLPSGTPLIRNGVDHAG
jgi:hypothetical protein